MTPDNVKLINLFFVPGIRCMLAHINNNYTIASSKVLGLASQYSVLLLLLEDGVVLPWAFIPSSISPIQSPLTMPHVIQELALISQPLELIVFGVLQATLTIDLIFSPLAVVSSTVSPC